MTHFRLPHYEALRAHIYSKIPQFLPMGTIYRWPQWPLPPAFVALCSSLMDCLGLVCVTNTTQQEVMACDYTNTLYAFLFHDFAHVFPILLGVKIPIPFLSSYSNHAHFSKSIQIARLSDTANNSNLPSLMTSYHLLAIPLTHTKVF